VAKVSTAIADQVLSSQFRFNEGKGMITAVACVFDAIQGYDTKCGVRLSVQRLDSDWNPTDDEPVDEVLGVGKSEHFHPANASSADDDDPQDLGGPEEAEDAEGNSITSIDGKKIDKQSKYAIFCKSLEEAGFKPAYLDGYLPHLVGLKAEFTQLPLPKGANFKGKNDPTCLAIKDKKIAVFPYEVKKGAAASKTATKTAAPAAKAAAKSSAKEEAPESETDAVDEIANEQAMQVLAEIHGKKAGQTITRQMVNSLKLTILPKIKGITPDLNKRVSAKFKDAAWLDAAAGELGWEVSGDDFTVPGE
jgi:hypothetical protein